MPTPLPSREEILIALIHEIEFIYNHDTERGDSLARSLIGVLRAYYAEQHPIMQHISSFIGDRCLNTIIEAQEARTRNEPPPRERGFTTFFVGDGTTKIQGVFIIDHPGMTLESAKHLLNTPAESELVHIKREDLLNGNVGA